MDDDEHGRRIWKALPEACYTTCACCGEIVYCHGRSRRRMLCLACFQSEQTAASPRRTRTPAIPRRRATSGRPQGRLVAGMSRAGIGA